MSESQDLDKLCDILVDYIREYQLKKFDPFYMREKMKFDINEYVSIILNQCIIFGATNVKRLKNTQFRALGDNFTISGDLEMTDFRVNVNFDAKLGYPSYRWHPTLKTCCVSLRNLVFNIEFKFNVKQKTISAKNVRLVSKDRVHCVSTGFIWPVNRTVETLIRKNVELFINENQSELEHRAKLAINEFFAPTFDELFDERSLVSNKEFKTIINKMKA